MQNLKSLIYSSQHETNEVNDIDVNAVFSIEDGFSDSKSSENLVKLDCNQQYW
jgi:hypothetical protein